MNSQSHINFLSFLLIIILFSSCKKSVNASGQVLDVYSGMGIADVEVTVGETKIKKLDGEGYRTWKSTTDNNGEFNVNFTGHKSTKYSYAITLPYNSNPDTSLSYERFYVPMLDDGIGTHNIEWNGATKIVLNIAPAAKVIIVTRNPLNKPVDAINFSWIAMGIEFGMIGSSGGVSQINAVNMPSNGQSILKITFTSNGVTKTTTDTFATVPFQVTRHDITL
jgi:hypothetical protein